MAQSVLAERADPSRPTRSKRGDRGRLIAAFLVGAVVAGTLVYWWVAPRPSDRVAVDVLSGVTTAVNSRGTAIGLAKESSGAGWIGGYDVTGATGSECLVPHSSGQPVQIGVVHLAANTPVVHGQDTVVWVRCLAPPARQP
jgi:hypothetical protein